MSHWNTTKVDIISFDDVTTIVRNALDNEHEVIDYKLHTYSNYNVGFLGDHKSIEITVRNKIADKIEKLNFFAKILPQDFGSELCFIKEWNIYNQEADFYDKIMPLLSEFYAVEQWGAKCYLAKDDVIVLEDIRARGYTITGEKMFNGKYLKSAARALARLHASSILAEKKLGKSLKEMHPTICAEQVYNQRMKDRDIFKALIELIEKIAQDNNWNCETISSAFENVYHRIHNPRGKYQVILHRDTWANNFMFDSQDPPNCILVDFQLTSYGSRMRDVTQMIYFCTVQETRKKEEMNTLKAYHDEFVQEVAIHDPSYELPNFSDTLKEYEDERLYALFGTMIYHPFLLMNKKEFLRSKNDPNFILTNFIFRSHNESVLKMMECDEEYKCHLTRTVLELIQLCEKMSFDVRK